MLSKKTRLPRAEFRSPKYHTIKTPYFLLKIKRSSEGASRVGVVVGKAVHKNAVKRNFWKRQAKQMLSKDMKNFQADILLIFSQKVNILTKKQFQEELSKALRAATK